MTTEELCAEIERLDAAATAGPWTIEGGGGVSMNGNRDYYIIEADTVWLLNVLGRVTPQERKANAEAIASYRTLAVEAARRLREAERTIQELKAKRPKIVEWAESQS